MLIPTKFFYILWYCTATFSDSSSKVLVITGYPYDESKHSEVIDVENEDLTCQDFNDFPYTVEGATGGLINKKLVICGGYGGEQGVPSCWMLSGGDHQTIWLEHAREYPSSIALPFQNKVSFIN